MAQDNEIFRQESLRALDDNSDITEYAKVVRPSLVVAICALGVCMLVALLWLFYGNVNLKTTAQGVSFPHSGLVSQSLPFQGRVDKIYATHGTYVSRGTPVMSVSSATAQSTVVADHDGVVLSYTPLYGQFATNEPILFMLPQNNDLTGREIIAFVSFKDLRWLKIGQKVQVTPLDLPREDYGYATGVISEIETYPISAEEAVQEMKMTQFPETIFPKETAYKIKIVLDKNGNNLNWSRAKSAHLKFPVGSFCNVQIITRTLKVYEVLVMKLKSVVNNIGDR